MGESGLLAERPRPLFYTRGKLRLGGVKGLAQSYTVNWWQSQGKNPGRLTPCFLLYQNTDPEALGRACAKFSQTPSLPFLLALREPEVSSGGWRLRDLSLRSVTRAAPEATPAPSMLPLPRPFMAFLSALASVSGLKSLAGHTVPFSCKKQKRKETQPVSGGPFRGQAKGEACEGAPN